MPEQTAATHYNGEPIPPGKWLTLSAEEARKLSGLPPSGLSPHDTVPVATYNRMVRKRDEAVRERDQAREQLARDWNEAAVPGGVDLVAAYQAWLDWYNADKQDEEDSLSHELAREYVLSLISELLQCRRDHSTGKQDGHE